MLTLVRIILSIPEIVRVIVGSGDSRLLGWMLLSILAINLLGLVTTGVILGVQYSAGTKRSAEWVRMEVDHSSIENTELENLKQYFENSDEARKRLEIKDKFHHHPIVFRSAGNPKLREKWPTREVRALPGLNVTIGIILWSGTGFATYVKTTNEVRLEDQHSSYGGAAFVWPRDDQSNGIIVRNPGLVVQFVQGR